jgi:hypothetical protein
MFGFLNRNTNHHPKVMLTEADIKKLKNNHGVVLFFMNGCGHCVDMKEDWNAAVDECRNNGIGHDDDDFVLGAIESGSTDMFQKHGITTNVSGYPTILYITSEGIKNGNTSHEKYEKSREKQEFIEWIKNKKNGKIGKNSKDGKQVKQMKPVKQMKQSGGGLKKRRTYRRKPKSKRHSKRHTRRHSRRHTKGGGCGCGTGGMAALFGKAG